MGATLIDNTNVRVKLLHAESKLPSYGSAEAAGADLYVNLKLTTGSEDATEFTLLPGESRLFKTGVSAEFVPGTYGDIRGRSGLAYKSGIAILGGIIDSDYRGDIGVILLNTSDKPFTFKHLDRIAQLIVKPYIRAEFSDIGEDESLDDTARGDGAYGSTGA